MECSGTLARVILLLVNGVFVIIGLCLLIIGILTLNNKTIDIEGISDKLGGSKQSVDTVLDTAQGTRRGAWIMLVTGILVLIISLFGFCGACKENKCMLKTFNFCIFVIIVLEIIIAIIVAFSGKTVDAELKKQMLKSFSKEYIGLPQNLAKAEKTSQSWDDIMLKFKCCGINGFRDFMKSGRKPDEYASRWYDSGRNQTINGTSYITKLPYACCVLSVNHWNRKELIADPKKLSHYPIDPKCVIDRKGYYTTGCYNALKKKAKENRTPLIITAIVFLVIEILLLILSSCLTNKIAQEERYA